MRGRWGEKAVIAVRRERRNSPLAADQESRIRHSLDRVACCDRLRRAMLCPKESRLKSVSVDDHASRLRYDVTDSYLLEWRPSDWGPKNQITRQRSPYETGLAFAASEQARLILRVISSRLCLSGREIIPDTDFHVSRKISSGEGLEITPWDIDGAKQ